MPERCAQYNQFLLWQEYACPGDSAAYQPAGVSEIVLSGMAGRTGLRPFYTRREKETALENMRRLEVADAASS